MRDKISKVPLSFATDLTDIRTSSSVTSFSPRYNSVNVPYICDYPTGTNLSMFCCCVTYGLRSELDVKRSSLHYFRLRTCLTTIGMSLSIKFCSLNSTVDRLLRCSILCSSSGFPYGIESKTRKNWIKLIGSGKINLVIYGHL